MPFRNFICPAHKKKPDLTYIFSKYIQATKLTKIGEIDLGKFLDLILNSNKNECQVDT